LCDDSNRMRAVAVLSSCIVLWVAAPQVADAGAPAWRPDSVEQFFIEPDQPAVLGWAGPFEIASPIAYLIRDYGGAVIASGDVHPAEGRLEVPVRLSAGFHEIEFPAAERRFGIVALPAFAGQPDEFFAIDTAMSWLVSEDGIREGLIGALARSGIGMARERLSWGTIHTGPGQWQWDRGNRYESLRDSYRRQGVDVLEMFHDAPRWLGLVGKYPADLHATAEAWRTIHGRWRDLWHALEIWNEPDIFFGDHLPADQYLALVRTLAFALREAPDLPLVGGSLAHFDRPFLEAAADNGLLALCDVLSFHTYARAEAMERIVGEYREFLKEHGRVDMPLWVTECGRPWKRGPDRPPQDQDAESAADIVMKAIEARACGVQRYFAFVYPYYDENEWNFGMMDRAASPLRSMAAYVQAARRLAGAVYVGDLVIDNPDVRRARVFGRGDAMLAVLYTGTPAQDVRVPLGVPAQRIEGIDGRVLPGAGERTVMVRDGLTYVWFDADTIAERLSPNREAMRLLRSAGSGHTPRQSPSPLVLRLAWDDLPLDAVTAGYRFAHQTPTEVSLRVRAFHLGAEAGEWMVRVEFGDGADRAVGNAKRPLRLEGGATTELVWPIDLTRAFVADGRLRVTWIATPLAGSEPPARLAIDLLGEADLEDLLMHYPRHDRLPIEQLDRWRPLAVGHAAVSLESVDDRIWRMDARFEEGDKWAYPQFQLPAEVALERHLGLLIRARCTAPATVRLMLWEGDTNVGYLTSESVITPDGRWRNALIRFDQLVPSAANDPDPNEQLDLDQVRRISLGFNSQAAENRLEVSDVYLITAKMLEWISPGPGRGVQSERIDSGSSGRCIVSGPSNTFNYRRTQRGYWHWLLIAIAAVLVGCQHPATGRSGDSDRAAVDECAVFGPIGVFRESDGRG
jgi:hypothetical protein